MSVAEKTHLIKVTVGNKFPQQFMIPESAVNGLLVFFNDYKVVNSDDDDYMDAEDVFDDLHKKLGKPAVRLSGFRHRNGLTQAELAKKIRTTQSVIASMERGKRPISYKMAQKLAKFFDTSPEAFLEN